MTYVSVQQIIRKNYLKGCLIFMSITKYWLLESIIF